MFYYQSNTGWQSDHSSSDQTRQQNVQRNPGCFCPHPHDNVILQPMAKLCWTWGNREKRSWTWGLSWLCLWQIWVEMSWKQMSREKVLNGADCVHICRFAYYLSLKSAASGRVVKEAAMKIVSQFGLERNWNLKEGSG